jgi:hypothetical protein
MIKVKNKIISFIYDEVSNAIATNVKGLAMPPAFIALRPGPTFCP